MLAESFLARTNEPDGAHELIEALGGAESEIAFDQAGLAGIGFGETLLKYGVSTAAATVK